jgi:outer membrane protein OmpA-like peptidoglycan-associated protein
MANNLLESLKEHLSDDVVANLASLLGESLPNLQSALKVALPALLSALVSNSENSSDLTKLFNLLKENGHDGGILSNLGALSRGGEETTKLLADGGQLLSNLFGDKVGSINDSIVNSSTVNKDTASSLLNFITPIALGLLGKNLNLAHIDSANSLAGFLAGQKDFLKNLIPTGWDALFASTLGIDAIPHPASSTQAEPQELSEFDKAVSSLDDGSVTTSAPDHEFSIMDTFDKLDEAIEGIADDSIAAVKKTADDMSESISEIGSHLVDEGNEFAHHAADAFEETTEKSGKLLPWLLIAAALALIWGLVRSCATEPGSEKESESLGVSTLPPAVKEPATTQESLPTPVPATPAPQAERHAPVAPPPTAKMETSEPAADGYEKTLSTGFVIKGVKSGFENKLIDYIESRQGISKALWFNMNGINFDTNRATIRAESMTQVNHLAEVLKAFPKVKIKIGGYTDNTGNDNYNKNLSNKRAKSVKKALVSQGIQSRRLDPEGYGSDHPIASNDSEEGRQKNRRIDVRVTAK